MPTVLHLRTVTGHGGGPEKTILNSPRFIGKEYKLEIAYIRPTNDLKYDLPERARSLGVSIIDVPERGAIDPRTLWRLSRIIRDTRPAILHAHDYKTNVLGVLLARLHKVRVMTTVHGYVTLSPKLNLYYRIDREALRRMDHIVAVSTDILAQLEGWGIPASRCSLVHNAIDLEQYHRRLTPEEGKRQLNFTPGRVLVGAVGRLSAEKGFDNLILAVDGLLKRGLDLELVIIGDGEERDRLKSLIIELKRGDRIKLLGHRTDMIDLYQAMDVFVLSSLREALPNVILEALAMEVPVVATRVAGVPQVIEHARNGQLVDPGDVGDLTSALGQLVLDRELQRQISSAGRRTVEERFCFSKRMQKISAIYDSLLGRRSKPTVNPFATQVLA